MKKIAVLLLSAVLALSTLTGCNKNKVDSNSPETLEIYILNQGYGYEWCQPMIDAFKEEEWVKEKYPNLQTDIYKDEVAQTAVNMLASGSARANRYDLLFSSNLTLQLTPTADCINLAEGVFNQLVPGENVTVKEKMIPSAREASRYTTGDPDEDEQYYMMNWYGGMMGIMYNKTQFDKLKRGEESVELPRTTDEFIAILNGIKNKTITGWTPAGNSAGEPFSTYQPSTYIDFVSNIWWAQYDGIEGEDSGYNNFYKGVVHNETGDNYSTDAITNAVGLKKTYEMLNTFLPDTSITWINPLGTQRNNYTDTQNKIVTGEHLFMVTGDWVMHELQSFYDGLVEMGRTPDTVSMMPVPVLSAVIEKTSTINDDATLSKVIKAIDDKTAYDARGTELESVSKDDWDKIFEARHIAYTTGGNSSAYIPSYAAGKDLAQDFLRYMATDKAQEIFMETTKGCQLPFLYDTSNPNYSTLSANFPELNKAALNVLLDPDIEFLLPEEYFPLRRFCQFTIKKPNGSRAEALRKGDETPESLITDLKGYWDEANRFEEAKSRLPYKPWEH